MRYVARKIGFYLLAAWLAITLNFFLPRLIPGNPVQLLMARLSQAGPVEPGEQETLTKLMGLGGGNLFSQYWSYLDQLVHLNFGLSITYFPVPVATVIHQEIFWTLILVGTALLISVVLGLSLGALAGWFRGTWLDALVPGTVFLSAIPYFWLALVLVYLLTERVHAVSPTLALGGYDPSTVPGWNWPFVTSAVQHSLLPALTIVVTSVGGWMFGMRNMMVSTIAEDYVVAAQAKGLSRRRVMLGYAARNAAIPSVSGFAIALGFVVSGSLAMEIVFSYPGIGYNLLEAVNNDDYPLMQGIFLFITLAVLGANLIVDLLHGIIDPRSRSGSSTARLGPARAGQRVSRRLVPAGAAATASAGPAAKEADR
ncbi:MAG TPA: ABC transporter permease [Actinocrinis sp.]|jgi:peptide/nickel transport system permease protein